MGIVLLLDEKLKRPLDQYTKTIGRRYTLLERTDTYQERVGW